MDKTPHWTHRWEKTAAQIEQQPRWLLATDYDGTLTPIAATPGEARIAVQTQTLLRRLAACAGVNVAIISGRALADLQAQVGIEGLFYVGNHGLEVEGPGIELHNPQGPGVRAELNAAINFLREKTAALPGVLIEDKGPTVAIHWRLASVDSRTLVEQLIRTVAETHPRLRVAAGKCVWELRPRGGWNKGDALTHLAAHLGLTTADVIYLGDDITDEDAFQVVQSGLSFRVGGASQPTAARYYIRDAAEVQSFLLCVLGVRSVTRPHDLPTAAAAL